MYKAKIRMLRAIAVLLIGISALFSSGCESKLKLHGFAHPHSDVTAPTFCLHEGEAHDKNAPPVPIYRISVLRHKPTGRNRRLEWRNWGLWWDGRRSVINEVTWELEYGAPPTEARLNRYTDQIAWVIEYAPDPEAEPSPRPFSCITYGKVPPGYIEKIPAVPLIPERLYFVLLEPQAVIARGGVYFIIRLDLAGHPTQLEYTIKPTRLDQIREITQE